MIRTDRGSTRVTPAENSRASRSFPPAREGIERANAAGRHSGGFRMGDGRFFRVTSAGSMVVGAWPPLGRFADCLGPSAVGPLPRRGCALAMSCARSLRELAPTRSWGPACREAGSPRQRDGYVAEAGAVIALYGLAVDTPIARSSAIAERVVTGSAPAKGRGAGSDLGLTDIIQRSRARERAAYVTSRTSTGAARAGGTC